MKVTVIEIFADKFTGEVYQVGDVINIKDQKRVDDLVERKLVKVEDVAEDKPKTSTAKRKRKEV